MRSSERAKKSLAAASATVAITLVATLTMGVAAAHHRRSDIELTSTSTVLAAGSVLRLGPYQYLTLADGFVQASEISAQCVGDHDVCLHEVTLAGTEGFTGTTVLVNVQTSVQGQAIEVTDLTYPMMQRTNAFQSSVNLVNFAVGPLSQGRFPHPRNFRTWAYQAWRGSQSTQRGTVHFSGGFILYQHSGAGSEAFAIHIAENASIYQNSAGTVGQMLATLN